MHSCIETDAVQQCFYSHTSPITHIYLIYIYEVDLFLWCNVISHMVFTAHRLVILDTHTHTHTIIQKILVGKMFLKGVFYITVKTLIMLNIITMLNKCFLF